MHSASGANDNLTTHYGDEFDEDVGCHISVVCDMNTLRESIMVEDVRNGMTGFSMKIRGPVTT